MTELFSSFPMKSLIHRLSLLRGLMVQRTSNHSWRSFHHRSTDNPFDSHSPSTNSSSGIPSFSDENNPIRHQCRHPHTLVNSLASTLHLPPNATGPTPSSSASSSNQAFSPLHHPHHHPHHHVGSGTMVGGPPKSFVRVVPKTPNYTERVEETAMIRSVLQTDPTGIIVITGPMNVGKTSVLEYALDDRPVAFVNMREYPSVSTIRGLSRILRKHFRDLSREDEGVLHTVKDHLGGVRFFGMEVRMHTQGKGQEYQEVHLREFGELLDKIEIRLEQIYAETITKKHSAITHRPVIVFGSGNKVRALFDRPNEEGRRAMKLFFRWIIHITAARKLCHVVVTSNDGLFVMWLQHELAMSHHIRLIYLPDPTRDQARVHLKHLMFVQNVPCPPDHAIEATLDMLGNGFHDIEAFITALVVTGDWRSAIESCIAKQMRQIIQALAPQSFRPQSDGNVNWTTGQWLSLIRLMDVKNGDIAYNELCHSIFMEDINGLHSLCLHGLLCYIPASSLSTIPSPAHISRIVVPNAAFLLAIRRVLSNLPTPLLAVRVALPPPKEKHPLLKFGSMPPPCFVCPASMHEGSGGGKIKTSLDELDSEAQVGLRKSSKKDSKKKKDSSSSKGSKGVPRPADDDDDPVASPEKSESPRLGNRHPPPSRIVRLSDLTLKSLEEGIREALGLRDDEQFGILAVNLNREVYCDDDLLNLRHLEMLHIVPFARISPVRLTGRTTKKATVFLP